MNARREEIYGLLINILTAGFNRSIGALEQAGAVDTRKMRQHYTGIGSKYHDLVTAQIEMTAKYGTDAILAAATDNQASHRSNPLPAIGGADL